MIKASAFILLLATLGFLTETVQMPFAMAKMTETPSCCEGMKCTADAGKGTPDAGKGSSRGKCNPDGSCNNTANCSNCPLCYMATMVGYHSITVGYTLRSMDYPALSAGQLAEYHSRSWKPPNAGIFLSECI